MASEEPEPVNIIMEKEPFEDTSAIPTDEVLLNNKLRKLVVKNAVFRESIAEFIATFLLVFMGDCVVATLAFSHANNVGLAAAPLGWGFALLVAVTVTGGASGCHANPAVTLAFASIRKVKWNRVLPYFLAQYLGAFTAAVLVFAVYYDSIYNYDGGERLVPPHENATAQIFATYPPAHVSLWSAFLDQIVGTAILLMSILAMIDPRNLAVQRGLYPLIVGFVLGAIVYALPYNCMAPLNPARDFSPRLFTLMIGYGTGVFSHRGYIYFLVPVIAPHVGALVGVWIYKLAIEIHWPQDALADRHGYSSTEKLMDDAEPVDDKSPSTEPLIATEH